jgi:hypothetical protein
VIHGVVPTGVAAAIYNDTGIPAADRGHTKIPSLGIPDREEFRGRHPNLTISP